MKNFPMDYNSSLEECIAIDVKIETKLELEKKAIAIENYYMEEYLYTKKYRTNPILMIYQDGLRPEDGQINMRKDIYDLIKNKN